jgi:ABC-2 type transport system permease protein
MAEIWRGTWVVAYREVLRFIGERSRIISSFSFPLVFLVIFGAGFGRVIGSLAPGVDFIQFMYPGIIAMTVLTSSLFAGVSVVWDREFGFLREILVAPIGRTGIILGVSLNPGIVLGLIAIVTILSLGLSGLGILIASFMTSQQGFQLLIQLLIFPLIFLAGVFFPVNNVPIWMEIISKVNPLTYGVDAIRQIFLGSNAGLGVTVLGHTMSVIEEVLVVGILGSIMLGAAIVAFNRQD